MGATNGNTGRVAAVIVTFNASEVLEGVLSSVRSAPEIDQIVVVDNGSSDGTRQLLAGQDDLDVVLQDNVGFAAGVNRGIEAARDGLDILVLNPDVVLDDGCVQQLVEALDAVGRRGVIVPRVLDEHGTTTRSLRRAPSVLSTLAEALVGGSRAGRFGEAFAPPTDGPPLDAAWATGAVLLLRRRAVERCGGFDESYFLYSEETELCLRFGDAGGKVTCVPTAVARHVGGAMGRNPLLWALRAVNRVRLHRQRHGVLAGVGMRLASLVFEARRVVGGGDVSRRAVRELLRPNLDVAAFDLATELGSADPSLVYLPRESHGSA